MTAPELKKIEGRVRLEASVDAGQAFTLRWRLQNEGDRKVYVYDRPTSYQPGGKLVDDPDGPYRFLRDDSLRVLIGDAPLPRRASVTTHVYPHCTAIEPGNALERVVRIPTPLTEHSAYWTFSAFRKRSPEVQRLGIEGVRFGIVHVLLDYVVDQPGLVARPALDGAVDFTYPGVVHAAGFRLHHAVRVPELTGARRHEIDARPLLAGEEAEPMRPRPGEREEE
jgi:hypothetical protein